MDRLAAVVVVLSAVLVVGTASAQGGSGGRSMSEPEVEARARFQLGQLYYSQGRFAEAAREFEAAYTIHPHPELLHNLYLARRDTGDVAGATDALTRYLTTARDLSASDRRLLEGRLAGMQRQLTASTTATSAATTAATSTSSSETTAETTTEETSDASEIARGGVEGGDGATSEAAPPSEEGSALTPPTAPSGGIGIAPGAVVLGVGAGALIGAAIAGGVALGVAGERDAACTLGASMMDCAAGTQASYVSRFTEARDAAWGLLVAGAATAAVGAALLAVGASEASGEAPPVTAACDPSGCRVAITGSF